MSAVHARPHEEVEAASVSGTILGMGNISDQLESALLEEKLPDLPEAPWKYFKKVPGWIKVPVSKLRTIRARPKGIKNAAKYMRMAYDGEMERRKPISLTKNADGTYTVNDGNSTTANAKRAGWKFIIGKLEDAD